MSTGYFGIPGSKRESDVTPVHAVRDGKPICGARLRKAMQFQWCAVGFEERYIECGRCKRILAPIFDAGNRYRRTR